MEEIASLVTCTELSLSVGIPCSGCWERLAKDEPRSFLVYGEEIASLVKCTEPSLWLVFPALGVSDEVGEKKFYNIRPRSAPRRRGPSRPFPTPRRSWKFPPEVSPSTSTPGPTGAAPSFTSSSSTSLGKFELIRVWLLARHLHKQECSAFCCRRRLSWFNRNVEPFYDCVKMHLSC